MFCEGESTISYTKSRKSKASRSTTLRRGEGGQIQFYKLMVVAMFEISIARKNTKTKEGWSKLNDYACKNVDQE
jgi:hypothetical protein